MKLQKVVVNFEKTTTMSVAELKTNLIQFIIETDNPSLLKKMELYFKNLREQNDWWDDMTTEQKKVIEESAAQIDKGEIVSNEQVREEINLLLGKK